MNDQLKNVQDALHLLCPDGVFEIRALGVPTGGGWTSTFSGYFDDTETAAGEAVNLDRKGAKGVYVTPNPVKRDLLARRNNEAKRCRKRDPLTKNGEIARRRWLLLDFDPVRPAGISSTEAELQAATDRAVEVARFLKGKGWPGGVLAQSGNGAHLMYRVDLPTDDHGLVKRVLQAVDAQFTDDAVDVDTGVHNAARIWKLYGTTARKGDATDDRPHRRARILRVADPVEVVPTARLQQLAVDAETDRKQGNGAASRNGASDGLSEREIERALHCIPPRPDYDNWFHIAAAVHHAVGGDVDTAERLLKAWSAEEKEGEYRRKLKSGLDGSITTGTLIRRAQQHGYTHPAKRNGHAKKSSHTKRNGRATKSGPPLAGVLASDVQPSNPRWIWENRLALGEISIIDGDPGLGKSTVICDFAARITAGRPMPLCEKPPRDGAAGVVLVTTEDAPDHTIRPRLDAAGADTRRVRIIQTVPTWNKDENDWSGPEAVPKIPEDLDHLRAAARDVDAALLVVDPLFAHMSGEINTFKDSDVRSALAPLSKFAHDEDLSIVVVRHLNKQSGGNSLYRGGGSIGIIGAARLSFAFGKDPDDPDGLALATNKINIGKRPPSIRLSLEESDGPFDVARVRWEETCSLSASDVFEAGMSERHDEAVQEAEAFLEDVLADGPRRSADVHSEREERGISKNTFYRAKDNLGITSEQEAPGKPYWMVPPWDADEDSTDTQPPLHNSWVTGQNAQNGDFSGESPNEASEGISPRWVTGQNARNGDNVTGTPENGPKTAPDTQPSKIRGDGAMNPPGGKEKALDAEHTFTEGDRVHHKVDGRSLTVTDDRGTVCIVEDDGGDKMSVATADLEPITDTDEVPF